MSNPLEFFNFLKPLLLDNTLANPTPQNVLVSLSLAIGLLYLSSTVLNLILSILSALRPAKNLKRYGAWAVVTGATDGIGLAYAKQLAKKGLKIVLISRSAPRLAEAEAEVKKYNVDTKVVVADFSNTSPELYKTIQAALSGLDIGILVNNVGVSYPSALYFDELDGIDPTLIDNLIALNVNAATQMTRIVIPGMVQRKRGAIINISSAAGRIPVGNPLYAVYSASKAYIDFFSRSLHYELEDKGIFVQCQSPYFVTSKLSKLRHASLTVPNPTSFAVAAVNAIGYGASVVPFWSHKVQDAVIQSLPTSLLASFLISTHKGIRKAFMKKREQKKD